MPPFDAIWSAYEERRKMNGQKIRTAGGRRDVVFFTFSKPSIWQRRRFESVHKSEGGSNSGQSQSQLRASPQTNRSPQFISFISDSPRWIYKFNPKISCNMYTQKAGTALMFWTAITNIAASNLYQVTVYLALRSVTVFSFSKKMMPSTTRNPPTSKSLIIHRLWSHFHLLNIIITPVVQSACHTRHI
jgi:hypothetical protein